MVYVFLSLYATFIFINFGVIKYNFYISRLVGVVCNMHGYDGKKLGHGSQDNYGAMTLGTDGSMTSDG